MNSSRRVLRQVGAIGAVVTVVDLGGILLQRQLEERRGRPHRPDAHHC